MKTSRLIITFAILTTCAGAIAALGQGNRIYSRQLWTSQVLTDAAASNSVPLNVDYFLPLGNYAVETRLSGTGTVSRVNVQASRDGTVWYDVATHVVSNQAVSVATGGASTNAYAAVSLPPALFYRLSGLAAANSPIVDAWIIIH